MANIFLVTIDDLFSLGAWPEYRDLVKTPHLDAFAQGSHHFEQAFAEIALCNPSRSATLSGKSPWETGIIDNAGNIFDVMPAEDTLPGRLNAAGFNVTMGGKVFHEMEDPRMDVFLAGTLDDNGDRNGAVPGSERIRGVDYGVSDDIVLADTTLAESVEAFLAQTQDGPFALAAGIYRPHADWIVPQAFFDLYDPADIPLPTFITPKDEADLYYALTGSPFHKETLAADAWVDLLHAYFASVSYADAMFGRMIDALNASEYASDTHVVVWSDHGYHLGDGGHWHKFSLWEESARAPLMIREAGQTTGQSITTPVSLSDIFPTVLELAGVPLPESHNGTSLLPIMQGQLPPDAPSHAVTWMYGGMSLRSNDYRYILNEDLSEELYHISSDPHRTTNLVNDIAAADVLDAMRAALPGEIPFDLHMGTHGADTLVGGSGNDLFLAGSGSDVLLGGAGNDVYALTDTLADIREGLEGGHDTVIVSGSFQLPYQVETLIVRNSLFGSPDHQLSGNDFDNTLISSAGHGTLWGGGGNDTLRGFGGDDTLFGGIGDDVLGGYTGNDVAIGNDGDDTITGHMGQDSIFGGAGDDWIDAGGGDDIVFGGSGNDILHASNGRDETIFGGQGDDLLSFGFGSTNAAFGGDGNDVIDAGPGGVKIINGNDGNDLISSSGSRMTVFGGAGDDVIAAAAPSDFIFSGSGHDTIDGGGGDDFVIGGAGNDHITVSGNSRTFGSSGDDVIVGGRVLAGQRGNDTLFGGEANALLSGGDGNDTLQAGRGVQQLVGGLGADSFVLHEGFRAYAAIHDFDPDHDRILIDRHYQQSGETASETLLRMAVDLPDRMVLITPEGRMAFLDISTEDVIGLVTFL